MFVPKHIILEKGDTIVTSSYNSIFPENIQIGFVDDFSLADDGYYDIDINLSNDFSNLAFVYVIKNPYREEKSELENEIQPGNE